MKSNLQKGEEFMGRGIDFYSDQINYLKSLRMKEWNLSPLIHENQVFKI